MWFYRYLLMFYSKLCNDFSKSYQQIFEVLNEMFFLKHCGLMTDLGLMSNFGSSVKAIRKASTHLTKEPFFFLIIVLFICNFSCNIF